MKRSMHVLEHFMINWKQNKSDVDINEEEKETENSVIENIKKVVYKL